MKRVIVCSATLGLLLPLTTALADEWERQEDRQQMMNEQSGMHSDGTMRQRQGTTEQNREMMMERGSAQSVEDVENMPATSAGQPHDGDMMHDKDKDMNRSGHKGEVGNNY